MQWSPVIMDVSVLTRNACGYSAKLLSGSLWSRLQNNTSIVVVNVTSLCASCNARGSDLLY